MKICLGDIRIPFRVFGMCCCPGMCVRSLRRRIISDGVRGMRIYERRCEHVSCELLKNISVEKEKKIGE